MIGDYGAPVGTAIREVTRTVLAGVEAGRLSAADGERLLGRLLVEAMLGAGYNSVQRELVALGVDPSVLEAAIDETRLVDGGGMVSEGRAGNDTADDVARLLERLEGLGDPAEWAAATTYNSIALAVIDSVWSIGVRYGGVLNVLERYRTLRRAQGFDPDKDGPLDLVECIEALGGSEAFAEAVKNRQRTSSRSGILKADAVLNQAKLLVEEGINSPRDLAEAASARLERLRRRWMEEVGQASGLSWDYLLMLSGMQGVKADRMVRRFVADALGCSESGMSAARAHALVTAAAERLGIGATQVDYAIWLDQSRQ